MSPFSRLLNRPYLVLLLCIVSCVACAILVNITHQSRYDQYEKENQFLKTKLGQFEGKMSSLTGNIEKLSNGHEKLKTSDFNHNVQSNKIEEDVNRMNSQMEQLKGYLKGHIKNHVVDTQEKDISEREGRGFEKGRVSGVEESTVLLIISYNRGDYLKRTLSSVKRYHPGKGIPVIISQDGDDNGVRQAVGEFKDEMLADHPGVSVSHISHQQLKGVNGYQALASHYGWALSRSFGREGVERVIILEEDIDISSDFFEFFLALSPMYDSDTSLLAISAWNDNGMRGMVKRNDFIFRSDFFPGLGWMINKRIWEELSPKWPKGYWDDWLREPENRKGRHTLHPEICRTYHFGEKGTSNSQYSSYLTNIHLNSDFTPFSRLDLSYLTASGWDLSYYQPISHLPLLLSPHHVDSSPNLKEVKIEYDGLSRGPNCFEKVARAFGIMDNIKAGVPRTAYKVNNK